MEVDIAIYMMGYLGEEKWLSALKEFPNQTEDIVKLMKIQEEAYSFKFEEARELYPKFWSGE